MKLGNMIIGLGLMVSMFMVAYATVWAVTANDIDVTIESGPIHNLSYYEDAWTLVMLDNDSPGFGSQMDDRWQKLDQMNEPTKKSQRTYWSTLMRNKHLN